MTKNEFFYHAKRGHGECVLELKHNNILNYENIVKRVFLNNYAFLINDEYRSSYSCELVSFYNNDKYFLSLLWNKIKRTQLENFYSFDYLINNLYFLLKRNKNYIYDQKIKRLLIKRLNNNFFTVNENKSLCSIVSLVLDLNISISINEIINQHYSKFKNSNLDLSNIEYCYKISLIDKKNSNLIKKQDFKDFKVLLECISNNQSFNKQLPYIVNDISDSNLQFLLDMLNNSTKNNSIKTNILKIILYSEKMNITIFNILVNILDKSTKEQ